MLGPETFQSSTCHGGKGSPGGEEEEHLRQTCSPLTPAQAHFWAAPAGSVALDMAPCMGEKLMSLFQRKAFLPDTRFDECA